MGINVEHGYHTAWQQDSPETYSPEADAKIREQHTSHEPLVAFVPKSAPREVYADIEVRGPERKAGTGDRFRPLKNATAVEPTHRPPEGVPGSGGPGEVNAPGETDFSGVLDPAVSTPTVHEARPVDWKPARDVATIAQVQEVLPELANSDEFVDGYPAALVEQQRLHVEVLERSPEDIYRNEPNRDEQILKNLGYTNSEQRELLPYNPNFQAILTRLPEGMQKKLQAIPRAP
jgi:hypothetical protein